MEKSDTLHQNGKELDSLLGEWGSMDAGTDRV